MVQVRRRARARRAFQRGVDARGGARMTAETDIWLNAIAAFPDVGPLVGLLRSDTPMPAGIRDLIAEMLAPGNPPIDAFTLKCSRNPAFKKAFRNLYY